MIEIVLVRHAQPHWEPDGHADDDPELTPLGREQAERLASVLGPEEFDAFYVSPLRRTRETAAPLAAVLDTEPIVLPWLEEMRLPLLAGKPVAEVHQFLAEARGRTLEEWWEGIPGGESFRHFHERIVGGIEPLLVGSHRAQVRAGGSWRLWQVPEGRQKILIVAHAGTSSVLVSHLLGVEPVPWEWERFRLGWAGIGRLVTNQMSGGCVWRLLSFDERAHLAGLPDPPG